MDHFVHFVSRTTKKKFSIYHAKFPNELFLWITQKFFYFLIHLNLFSKISKLPCNSYAHTTPGPIWLLSSDLNENNRNISPFFFFTIFPFKSDISRPCLPTTR